MDWYLIEILYPKSFKKFVDIMFPNIGVISKSTLIHYDTKKLYSFFDYENIFLIVEMINKNQWTYTINIKGNCILSSNGCNGTTREDTENEGFQECFKILEKKINYKDNHVENEL